MMKCFASAAQQPHVHHNLVINYHDIAMLNLSSPGMMMMHIYIIYEQSPSTTAACTTLTWPCAGAGQQADKDPSVL